MFTIGEIVMQARRVHEHAIAVNDLHSSGDASVTSKAAMHMECGHLGTALSVILIGPRLSGATTEEVEELAHQFYRLAVVIKRRQRAGVDADKLIAEIDYRFAKLAASLGYDVEPIDEAVATKPASPSPSSGFGRPAA